MQIPKEIYKKKNKELTDMGFTEEQAKNAQQQNNIIVEKLSIL